MVMYMTSVHPSIETHWKIVTSDHMTLSKVVYPKLKSSLNVAAIVRGMPYGFVS